MKRLPTVLSTNPKSLPGRENSYVRVALDVPLPRLFDYALPEGGSAARGDRVTVPLGSRRQTGVVVETEIESAVALHRLKAIVEVRNDAPRLPPDWLELMRFLASYYQRPFGETVIASLPPRLRSVKRLPRRPADAAAATAVDARFITPHRPTPEQQRAIEQIAAALGTF